jgi:hypothetical protein
MLPGVADARKWLGLVAVIDLHCRETSMRSVHNHSFKLKSVQLGTSPCSVRKGYSSHLQARAIELRPCLQLMYFLLSTNINQLFQLGKLLFVDVVLPFRAFSKRMM